MNPVLREDTVLEFWRMVNNNGHFYNDLLKRESLALELVIREYKPDYRQAARTLVKEFSDGAEHETYEERVGRKTRKFDQEWLETEGKFLVDKLLKETGNG